MEEASLRRVLAVLRGRWATIVVLGLPVLLASGVYAATLPPAYTASVVLSFAPAGGTDPGPSFVSLIPRYEVAATSQGALDAAEQSAGLSPGTLDDAVSVELPDDSLELTLTVTARTPEAATAAAGAVASVITEAAAADDLLSVWTARQPEAGSDRTPLRRAVALTAGLLLAPVPGVVVSLLLEGGRPRVRLPEDISAAGLPFLQELPSSRRLAGRGNRAGGDETGDEVRRPGPGRLGPRPPLRLWLLILGSMDHCHPVRHDEPQEVVVSSLDGRHADAERIVEGLRPLAKSLQPGSMVVTAHAAPWLSVREEDQPTDAARKPMHLLVVRSGLPQDDLRAAAELLAHRADPVLGAVLLSR